MSFSVVARLREDSLFEHLLTGNVGGTGLETYAIFLRIATQRSQVDFYVNQVIIVHGASGDHQAHFSEVTLSASSGLKTARLDIVFICAPCGGVSG